MRRVTLAGFICVISACHMLGGCATVSDYTEEHPAIVAGASIAALAVGGIMVAHVIAHGSGRTQVIAEPRRQLGPL